MRFALADELPRLCQRGFELVGILAAAAGEVGFAAAFAADDGGDGLDDLAGLDFALVLFGDAGDEGDATTAGGGEDDNAVEGAFEGFGHADGVVGIHVTEVDDDAVVDDGFGDEVFGLQGSLALLRGFEGFFEFLLLGEDLIELLLQIGGALGADFAGEEL